jgi:outer membrane protein assembly factor BamD (BamD/ComL family)
MQVTSTSSIQANRPASTQHVSSVRDQFKALDTALSTGSVQEAKQIYANLQKQGIGQKLAGQKSPVELDFAALGKALDSNDLAGARQAYATLKTDYQYATIAAKVQQAQEKAQSSIASLSTPSGTTSASTSQMGLVSAAQLIS